MNDFNCSCVPGYTGKNCSVGKPILYVIESCYLQQLITDLITAEYEMQQNADRGQKAGNYPNYDDDIFNYQTDLAKAF